MTQSKTSEMWLELPWKKFKKETFRLQRRIFEASRREDWVTTFNLQKLLFSSYSARMIAIQQVTQLNSRKKTAGIDGKTFLTNHERFILERKLYYEAKIWKHQGLKQISITKPNGRVKMLKIPTISDRAWQGLVKLALEPAHEAWFNKRSYGFRPGRCNHDAQRFLFTNLNSWANGFSKRIIQLDIEKCFDKISHQSILKKAIAPQRIKQCLDMCLKTGVNPEYPEQGTLQGGVINPLLANIALNGIENIHTSVRYADEMIIILKPEDDEKNILNKISNFISKNGMNVNNKKTKVSTTQLGFDFLGWNFRFTSKNKFISTPSKDNYKNLKMKLNEIIKNSAYGVDELVKYTSTIIRGWRNYHKYCDMSKHNLWHINHKTWKRFIKQPSINRKKADFLVKKAFPLTA
jgi:RNA-directed DNA polymerase